MKFKSKLVQAIGPPQHLLQDHVDLTYGKWGLNQWDKYSDQVQSWSCSYLLISNNLRSNMIKQIRNIEFEGLIHLNISNNNIDSLESIAYLKSPKLQCLDLSSNKINTYQTIAKLNAITIKKMHIQENPCPETTSKNSLALIHAPNLKIVSTQYYFFNSTLLPDTAHFFKLETEDLREIYVESQKRIPQPELLKSIKQKYINLKIGIEALDICGNDSDDDQIQSQSDQDDDNFEDISDEDMSVENKQDKEDNSQTYKQN